MTVPQWLLQDLQAFYSAGAGATLAISAFAYLNRRKRWIEKIPRMERNIRKIAKHLKIYIEEDDD